MDTNIIAFKYKHQWKEKHDDLTVAMDDATHVFVVLDPACVC